MVNYNELEVYTNWYIVNMLQLFSNEAWQEYVENGNS